MTASHHDRRFYIFFTNYQNREVVLLLLWHDGAAWQITPDKTLYSWPKKPVAISNSFQQGAPKYLI
jgi:hypothetical protein